MTPILRKLLFAALSIISTISFAQTATIRGFVYDKKTGEPIIFTNVYLDGTNYGVATDVNGYYSLSKVPAGKYNLTVYAIGYEKFAETIILSPDQLLNKRINLNPSSTQLSEVQISAEQKEKKTQVTMSVAKITPKDIKSLPSVGGEPDLAQYLQVLPGVIFTGDQGGQLYVRGGSPIQNKVMLDGMVVYNPFHSIGLYSVFDTDIIRNADVYTGGFNAEYGGRISSVMDITTRDGNKSELDGKINLSPFGSKVVLEGPLYKQKTDEGGSASFILSARNSYLKQTSKIFYNYVNNNGEGLPFNFADVYGKLSFNSGNGSKVNAFGFNFTDQVRYQGVSDLQWSNLGGGANFVLVPAGNPVLIQGNFSYSDYKIGLNEANLAERTSQISGFNLGLDFKYFQGDNEWKYGVQVLGFSTEFNYFGETGKKIEQEENTTELAAYLSYKLSTGLLVFEPSFRMQYYASLSEPSFEPRLGLKYNISEFVRFKAAGGLYSQNLISANSDRDVVNLFYGFLSGPENLQNRFTKQNGEVVDRTSKLQKSTHYIAGFEFDVTKKLNLNVEAYYKVFNQLTNINRNKIFEDNQENADRPDAFKKDFIIETGTSRGLDFVLKYTEKNYNIYLVYSLSKVDRWDGLMTYLPVFDRRHNINFVGSYYFGKNRSWEVSGRWNFGSGFPFTPTQGFFEKIDFAGGSSTNITQTNGELGVLYGDLNSKRLPAYHRMDVSIKKTYKFKNKTGLEVGAGASNIYDRKNVFYFDRIRFTRVNQLPILPSANISFTF